MSVQVSYKKQAVLGILLLLITLVAIESVLRIYDHYNPNCLFTSSEAYANTDDDLKRSICFDNDNLIWYNFPYLHLEPNQHFTTINVNDDGFRGKEISLEKPSNTFRIIMVGGSTAFGVGSSSDLTTIPGYLQNYYDSNYELNIEVINAGMPNAFSYTETNYIKNKLVKYNPDLFVIYDAWNDLDRSTDTYFDGGGDDNLISNILRILTKNPYYKTVNIIFKIYNYWKFNTVEQINVSNLDYVDERVGFWKNSWNEICDLSKENDFEVLITLQPLVGTGFKQLTNEELRHYKFYNQDALLPNYEKYAVALNELNANCTKTADLRNVFDDIIETVYFDSGHVGDLGNQIVAKKLFEISLPIVQEIKEKQ